MHKMTNLWKFELNWSSKLPGNKLIKTPLSHEAVCFHMLDFTTSNSNSEVSNSNSKIFEQNFVFLKNYVTSEGAVSHNVLYYQQLSISVARYRVSFYANNYFE